jgi:hypothetical protein
MGGVSRGPSVNGTYFETETLPEVDSMTRLTKLKAALADLKQKTPEG